MANTQKLSLATRILFFLICCCLFLLSSSLPTATSTQTLQEDTTTENSISSRPLSLLSPYILDLEELSNNPELLKKRVKMIQDHQNRMRRRHRALSDGDAIEGEVYDDKNYVKHGPMSKVGGALTALYNTKMEEKAAQSTQGAEEEKTSDQARRITSSEPLTEAAASSMGINVHDGRVDIDIVVDTLDSDGNSLNLGQVMNAVLSDLASIGFEKTGQYQRNLSGSIPIDQIYNLASIEYITFARPVRGQTLTKRKPIKNRRQRNRVRAHRQRQWNANNKKDSKSKSGKSSKGDVMFSWWNNNKGGGGGTVSWWSNEGKKSSRSGKSSKGGKKATTYRKPQDSWHDSEPKCVIPGGQGEVCEPLTGLVTTQGDGAMRTNQARRDRDVRGRGVTVGVISSSFGCSSDGLTRDIQNGEIPSNGVTILDDDCEGNNDNDEGRAMSQIVHDIAPGASQAFHPGLKGQASFAEGIIELARDAGASVIVDDVLLFEEPMFMNGVIAQAVNAVSEGFGVSYISASGNLGTRSFESDAVDWVLESDRLLYNFNVGSSIDTRQTIEIGPGSTTIVLQWDEPYASAGTDIAGSTSDLDIFIYFNGDLILSSSDVNIGQDPIEVLPIDNNGPSIEIEMEIEVFEGDAPSFIKYVIFGPEPNIIEYDTKSSTSFGHLNTDHVMSIGAAYWRDTPPFGVSPAIHRDYSSLCGCPILFDDNGNRLDEPLILEQPVVVGPDGGSTSVLGFDTFDGTSAAAPHIAGVVALMHEANCYNLTPDQVKNILQMTASDMDDKTTPDFDVGFDFTTGYGYVNAPGAIVMAKGN